MKPGIDPKVDYAFKRLFGSEDHIALPIDLVNAVLKPSLGLPIDWLEILNPFNDKDALDDKLSILDIKARDTSGRYFNIEMQMAANRVFPHRILYYWSLLHGIQLSSGDQFEALKQTISISIVNDVVFPTVPDYHLEFGARNTKNPGLIFSPHLALHVIELPKFRLTAQELTDPLERWCYFLKHGKEFDTEALPDSLKVPPVQKAMEVMEMLSQTKLDWLKYQDRLKAIRDQHSREVEAAEDREQAIAQVRQEMAQEIERTRQDAERTRQEAERERQEAIKLGIENERNLLTHHIQLLQRILSIAPTPLLELESLPLHELKARTTDLEKQLPT